ncbi:lipoprotein-releasing ABC transporter permease subunit [Desulfamplus magnetovallimortis]|uniref:lipoprotein-releasing ABC transporter permease subunit n=1 Tax=Desulfamplus magnetovallimortis TaxID=1246637 RepID=UPI001FE6CC63|nr:lipoprotein-releasing ABC transporter permease subunit [Desulfamplus magnetovallimortis]
MPYKSLKESHSFQQSESSNNNICYDHQCSADIKGEHKGNNTVSDGQSGMKHTFRLPLSFEFVIAGRYLRARRKEGFISLISMLSVAGVMVGVMALVVVIAVMSGAETEFRERILGVEPHILVMEYSGMFNNYPDAEKKVLLMERTAASYRDIISVSPLVFGQAMIRTSSGMSGAVLRGIDPESGISMIKGYSTDDLKKLLGEDRLALDPSSAAFPGIILGRELARNIGVKEGDKIILMSTGGILSPVGHMPSMKRFEVVGLFESGMYEYDTSLVYVNIRSAQSLMGMGSRISAMGVWVDDIYGASAVKDAIVDTLDYPYYARDWMEINQSLFSALKLEKTAMFVILTLIILVAAFNIASALIMMVMEKTRDIAVFKAMGATDRMVRKIFMIQGMIIGLSGTVMGTVTGVIVCFLLKKYEFIELPAAYPFSTLPVQLEAADVILIAAASFIICLVSTLYPSYKASRTNPVEALRYG